MADDLVTSGTKTRADGSKVINSSHILTLFFFIYILVFTAAWGQSRDRGGPGPGRPDVPGGSTTDELAPVAVTEATPRAMEYYRSGNWLWVLSRVWSIVVPAALVMEWFARAVNEAFLGRRLAEVERLRVVRGIRLPDF